MPLPSQLSLDDVIKKLQAYNSNFHLYDHKTKKQRWVLSYGNIKDPEEAYPLTAPQGKKTSIDRQRLKAIAGHFDVPPKIFNLTEKEIKREFKSS